MSADHGRCRCNLELEFRQVFDRSRHQGPEQIGLDLLGARSQLPIGASRFPQLNSLKSTCQGRDCFHLCVFLGRCTSPARFPRGLLRLVRPLFYTSMLSVLPTCPTSASRSHLGVHLHIIMTSGASPQFRCALTVFHVPFHGPHAVSGFGSLPESAFGPRGENRFSSPLFSSRYIIARILSAEFFIYVPNPSCSSSSLSTYYKHDTCRWKFTNCRKVTDQQQKAFFQPKKVVGR